MCNDFNMCIKNRKYFGKNKNTNKFIHLRMTLFFFSVTQGGVVGLRVPLDAIWGHRGDFYKMYCKEQRRTFSPVPVRWGTTSYRDLTKSISAFLVLCPLLLNCLGRCTDLILIFLYKHSVNYSAHIQPGIMSCFHQSCAQILHFKMHSW